MFYDGRSSVRLTAEEERELARRRDAGDAEARNLLVERNIPLAIKISAPYQARWPAFAEDLLGEAMLGLIRAADGFDPEAGCRFSTYASTWINQRLGRWLADHSRLVRVPAYLQSRTAGRSRSKFKEAADRSLGALTGSLSDCREDPPTTCRPEAEVEAAESLATLGDEVAALEGRDGEVIRRHYGIGERDPEPITAISRSYGLSIRGAEYYHKRALATLARRLEARGITA